MGKKPPSFKQLAQIDDNTPLYHQYSGDTEYQSTAADMRDYIIRTAGADKHFEYERLAPSTSWSISHNLGKRPSIQIIDHDGDTVIGQYNHVDNNTLIITFSSPTAGVATLN